MDNTAQGSTHESGAELAAAEEEMEGILERGRHTHANSKRILELEGIIENLKKQ